MYLDIVEQLRTHAAAAFFVFLRIGAAMSVAPGYGEATVPARVKLVIALFFALAVSPIVPIQHEDRSDPVWAFWERAGGEAAIGLFLGLVARGMVFLLQVIGSVISHAASLVQFFGNATQNQPIFGHIFLIAGLALIFSTPLAGQILFLFVMSYTHIKAFAFEIVSVFAEVFTELVNFIFINGVVISSGFLIFFLVYYIFTGFINKTMPQFMVTFIGVPFVSLASIYIFLISYELVFTVWHEKARDILLRNV